MENWTQLGIAGLTLAILAFIVRYFVSALDKKDARNIELANKLLDLSEENIKTNNKLAESIDKNTEIAKTTSDNLTKLMVEVIKSK